MASAVRWRGGEGEGEGSLPARMAATHACWHRYLESKRYNWAGITEIPSLRGKLVRALQQFTPYSTTHYEWGVFKDVRRLLYVVGVCIMTTIVDLDSFFLKDIFWIQPPSQ